MFYNHNTIEMDILQNTTQHCYNYRFVETQGSTTTTLQKCRESSNITPNNIEINIKCKDTRFYNHCRNVKSVETGRHIVLYNHSVVEMQKVQKQGDNCQIFHTSTSNGPTQLQYLGMNYKNKCKCKYKNKFYANEKAMSQFLLQ